MHFSVFRDIVAHLGFAERAFEVGEKEAQRISVVPHVGTGTLARARLFMYALPSPKRAVLKAEHGGAFEHGYRAENGILDRFVERCSHDGVREGTGAAVKLVIIFQGIACRIDGVREARGVIVLTLAKECGKLFEYTPLQIKQALTGYGRAEKKQIQAMTTSLLGLAKIPRPDDAADALAVALTHANTNRFSSSFGIK